MLRSVGAKDEDLRKANTMAKLTSQKNLQMMLPKLRRNHLEQTLKLTERQDKIMALLKEDKINPSLNESATRRRFFKSPSTKSNMVNNDLEHL